MVVVRYHLIWLILCLSLLGNAQSISGTINSYAEVTAIAGSTFTVASAAGFAPGDIVLIIQMKGAQVDVSMNFSNGQIYNYNCAGCFEYAHVASIAGTSIVLDAAPTNTYDATTGHVQLVTVPYYAQPVVTGVISAPAWNGSTGGIVALETCDTLTLNANIEVDGDGFRGGNFCNFVDGNVCNGIGNAQFPYNGPGTCDTGEKGESIAELTPAQSGGRNSSASGGGPASRAMGGAGGGGNFGAGGLGGTKSSTCALISGTEGQPGQALNYTVTRAFFGGGGGGASNAVNTSIGPGGNGGGIVMIGAKAIKGNGNSITANGDDVTYIADDGGGSGGGAGGYVSLNVDAFVGNLTVETNGGFGASNFNTFYTTQCNGPGAGGGGGLLRLKSAVQPAGVNHISNGGLPGTVNNPVSICFGSNNNAQPGQSGSTELSFPLVSPANGATANPSVIAPTFALCPGDTDTLVATGALLYFWSPATGLSATTGSVVAVSPLVSTTYTVTGVTCDDTTTTTVSVSVINFTSSFTGLNPLALYCANDNVGSTLTGIPAGGTFSGPGIAGNQFVPSNAGVGTHNIVYTAIGPNLCVDTDTQSVEIPPLPVLSMDAIGPDFCANAPAVSLSGTPLGGTFSGPGVLGSSFEPKTAGAGTHTLSYTVTDGFGCSNSSSQQIDVFALPVVTLSGLAADYCEGDAGVSLNGTPVGGIFSGPGTLGSIFDPGTVDTGSTAVYYTFTDVNMCTNVDTQTTFIRPLPIPIFVNFPAQKCFGDTGIIIATPPGGVFSGTGLVDSLFLSTISGVGKHPITYAYTDFGCVGTVQDSIEIAPLPVVQFSGLDPAYCVDGAAVNLTGLPADGLYAGNGISSSTFLPAQAAVGTHQITYAVTDTNGCVGADTQNTVIQPLPQASILATDTLFCAGALPITIATSPVSGTLEGPGIVGQTFDPSAATGTQIIRFTHTDLNGCRGIDEQEMIVQQLPEVSLFQIPFERCTEQPVFLDGSPLGGIFSGPGVVDDLYDPFLAGKGVHTLTYEYTDDWNCTNESTISVGGACIPLYAPNAFTPNNDNINDFFEIKTENITAFNLLIFNRWGEVIFQSKDPSNLWDGTYKGQACPTGIYTWQLEYSIGKEPEKKAAGRVTLIR